MMGTISLPESVAPGPTKPEVRAVLLQKLQLRPGDHFVDVGAGSGAVSIEANQHVDRVTAIEGDTDRVNAIRTNLRANGVETDIEVRHGEAPLALPGTADVVFIGGTRHFESVLEELEGLGARRVVLNAARLETAAAAVEAFETRSLLEEVLMLRIERGYELGGETGFEPDTPVFMVVGAIEPADDEYRRGGQR